MYSVSPTGWLGRVLHRPVRSRLFRTRIVVLLLVLTTAILSGCGESNPRLPLASVTPLGSERIAGQFVHPIRLPQQQFPRQVSFDVDAVEVWKSRMAVPVDETLTASRWLHLASVLGLDCRQEYQGRQVSARTLFTDEREAQGYFGGSLFSRTPHGIRFQASSNHRTQEVHRDQCLAVLGQLGFPVDQELVFADGPVGSMRDVLYDSMANFHLGQNELAWTAIAYSIYLPPQVSWSNKFHQRFTFDDLADALVTSHLDGQSCTGVHVAESINTLYRVNQEYSRVLSRSSGSRLKKRLDQLLGVVVASQNVDGGWSPDWYRAIEPNAEFGGWKEGGDPYSRLLATGHVLGWLLSLPSEFAIPNDVLEKGESSLVYQVNSLISGAADRFCPVSHGVHVLDQLSHGNRESEVRSSQ